jgi:WD40 repeat protein
MNLMIVEIIMRTSKKLRSFFLAAILLCCLNVANAAEPPSEPILRIDPGEHTGQIRRIATDDAGRFLVTASDDKTARVWSLTDGHLLNTLRIPIGSGNEGKLFAVALSPDGQTVALGGWTGWDYDGSASIFLFDRASV